MSLISRIKKLIQKKPRVVYCPECGVPLYYRDKDEDHKDFYLEHYISSGDPCYGRVWPNRDRLLTKEEAGKLRVVWLRNQAEKRILREKEIKRRSQSESHISDQAVGKKPQGPQG